MNWAVIMAGGRGTRFWPVSREKSPKQLQKIVSDKTMLRETIDRLSPFVKKKNIVIVTNEAQVRQVKRELPEVPAQNVIAEPRGRNTAAAIGLATVLIAKKDPTAVMICLPADHVIRDKKEFHRVLESAAKLALEGDNHITIGIKPSRPATGYGYIKLGRSAGKYGGRTVYRVGKFVEKPGLKKAERFLKSGKYLWNSGMFVWQAAVIFKSIKKYMPELFKGLYEIDKAESTAKRKAVTRKVYSRIKSVSVDYGIMEKVKGAFVFKGDFGWSDLGSWKALDEVWPGDMFGNAARQDIVSIESSGNVVDAGGKLAALVGVEGLAVIATEDAILVAAKDKAEDVKKVVDFLERRKMKKFL